MFRKDEARCLYMTLSMYFLKNVRLTYWNLSTLRVGLPPSTNSLCKYLHRQVERYVSYMVAKHHQVDHQD